MVELREYKYGHILLFNVLIIFNTWHISTTNIMTSNNMKNNCLIVYNLSVKPNRQYKIKVIDLQLAK